MSSLSIHEIIDRSIKLEERVTLAPLLGKAEIRSLRSEISQFLGEIEEKFKQTVGRRNKRRLKRLSSRWYKASENLGTILAVEATKTYPKLVLQTPQARARGDKSRKELARFLNRWAMELRDLVTHPISERKLHADFVLPTQSNDPELQKIIDAMHGQ